MKRAHHQHEPWIVYQAKKPPIPRVRPPKLRYRYHWESAEWRLLLAWYGPDWSEL